MAGVCQDELSPSMNRRATGIWSELWTVSYDDGKVRYEIYDGGFKRQWHQAQQLRCLGMHRRLTKSNLVTLGSVAR